jgi:HK97 family phage portal protein
MGLLSRTDPAAYVAAVRSIAAESRFSIENPNASLSDAMDALEVGVQTAAGVNVSDEGALRVIPVYAAVRYLAESIASLPFKLYRRDGRSRVPVSASEDSRAFVIHDQPNEFTGAMTFWETIIGHANLHGNAYAYIERHATRGDVLALWILDPRLVLPQRDAAGRLFYVWQTDRDGQVAIPARDVLHIRMFGTGDVGISPIGVMRQALGESLAAEEYAGRVWANDAKPGGVITYAKKLDDTAHKEAVRKWNAMHQGVKRSNLVAVLDNGATWTDVGVRHGDMQFLESRKWTYRQTAAAFRVPPHKIGDLEGNVTFASIDAQEISAVVDSLRPWCARIEQEVNRKIFAPYVRDSRTGMVEITRDGREGLYSAWLMDGLLRGDMKTRHETYAVGRQWGYYSIDDVREKEDLPAIGEAKGGDVYLQPMNMVPAGTTPEDLSVASQSARAFLTGLGMTESRPADAE